MRRKWLRAGGAVLLATCVFAVRSVLWQAAVQLFWGMLLALAALPLTRRVEKRFSAGWAAGLSLTAMAALLAAAFGMLIPALVRQAKQLTALLPSLYASAEQLAMRVQGWLAGIGFGSGFQLYGAVAERGRALLSAALPELAGWLGSVADGVGQRLLTPVFAFYFLRDRRRISRWLLSLLPVGGRPVVVRILREMKRETAGYLRGQLLISAVVGAVTAAGLLLCGVPAWLLLGALMGVLELIPYAGPFLGGVIAVLFALPGGMARTLWTLGVVLAVQQLEGNFLSPGLVSGATQLHPLAVMLCVLLGGAAGGLTGVVLCVPLVLCLRAAVRVISLAPLHEL